MTITIWNVQNFAWSDPVIADKLNFLLGTLQALRSDVVALQEILDPNALQDLANGLGFQHFAAAPDSRGIRVAFLTRSAPAGSPLQIDQWHLPHGIQVHDFDNNGNVAVVPVFPRAAFQITVAHNSGTIDIVTAHLKSKLLTFRGYFSTTNETRRAHTAYFALERRSAEAASLRDHVTSRLAMGRDVVVLGDFNDGPEAATTQILYAHQAASRVDRATQHMWRVRFRGRMPTTRGGSSTGQSSCRRTNAGHGATTDRTSSSTTSWPPRHLCHVRVVCGRCQQ